MKSRIVRLLHTKLASDFDGRTVHHEKEHLILHHEQGHYLQLSVMPYHFHCFCLKRFPRFPEFYVFSYSSTHSRFSNVRSSSQKLIFSVSKERYCKILSEIWTSRKLTRNLQPFIRLYQEKRLQLDHSAVQQLSFNKSSMRIAWVQRVVVNAETV